MNKSRINLLLSKYIQLGIKHILVVRGDFIDKADRDITDFNYANELIEYIRHWSGDYFYITVAAYPEFHPQATNPTEDLLNFKRKVDAGADAAVTQYFFNA